MQPDPSFAHSFADTPRSPLPRPEGMLMQPAMVALDVDDDLPAERYSPRLRVAAALMLTAFTASTIALAYHSAGRRSLLINGGHVAPVAAPR
jgi:hypothetical protein